VADHPEAVQAARVKLAEAVLEVANNLDEFEVNGLAELSLDRMYAEHTELK
jgi:hypothetical protein